MRKRKDTKIKEHSQVDDTLQNREEGVEITEIHEPIESIYEEDQNEGLEIKVEEVISESDEEKLNKEKIKRQDMVTIDSKKIQKDTSLEELEKEETETVKIKKVLKIKKSDIKDEDLHDEEIEDLDIIQNLPESIILLNIPNQQNEIVSANQAIDQAPEKPLSEKASISLDIRAPLIKEYTLIQEKEDNRVIQDNPEGKKASVSVLSLEPFSTTETIVQSKTEELLDKIQPHSVEVDAQLIPSEGIIIQEINPSEAKPVDLKISSPEFTNSIEISHNLQEAKIVSEMVANEKEKLADDYESPNLFQAEFSFVPQKSISILEIQEGLKEDTVVEIKPALVKPRVKLDEIESIQVQEIQTADKPGKYYPELIVPTEIATTSIIEQKQYITEEQLVTEKEEEYLPHKLPLSLSAETKISNGGEVATIYEQPIQEKEDMYHPKRKFDTFQATSQINLLESINVSSIDLQAHESELEIEEFKKFSANINLIENIPIVTSEETVAEKENIYPVSEKPIEKVAEKTILPLELGIITSTIIQDSEGEYIGPVKPTAAIAEKNVRPEECLSISEVQTADYPSEYIENLKFVTDSGVLSIETTEAKYIQETLIHDQENILKDDFLPDKLHTQVVLDEAKSLEIVQMILAEKEKEYKIPELPESHKGKEVPTNPMVSYETIETNTIDNIGSVIVENISEATAKLISNDLEGMIIKEVFPIENLSEVTEKHFPETKSAEIVVNEVDSINTTEIIITDKEAEFDSSSPITGVTAIPNYTTQITATQEITRAESPTEEIFSEEVSKKNIIPTQVPTEAISISIQQPAEKEDSYKKEIKPSEKTAELMITEANYSATTLEIIPIDTEQSETSNEITPQDAIAGVNISGHNVAVKTEILFEQNTMDIVSDKPKTSLALSRQEAFDELIVTETNVAEMEKSKERDIHPISQYADVELTMMNNLTINEYTTVLNKVCRSNILINKNR